MPLAVDLHSFPKCCHWDLWDENSFEGSGKSLALVASILPILKQHSKERLKNGPGGKISAFPFIICWKDEQSCYFCSQATVFGLQWPMTSPVTGYFSPPTGANDFCSSDKMNVMSTLNNYLAVSTKAPYIHSHALWKKFHWISVSFSSGLMYSFLLGT